ncbi:MAG: hypothetical protein HEQ39_12175 [Rhizobacter sp.]
MDRSRFLDDQPRAQAVPAHLNAATQVALHPLQQALTQAIIFSRSLGALAASA